MQKISTLLTLFFCSIVSAQESSCHFIPEIQRNDWPNYSPKDCECSKNLSSKYKISSPKGFTLVAICGRRDEDSGGYFFRGSETITGEITRNEYASGSGLSFYAPQIRPYKRFANLLSNIKFIDEESAFKQLKSPKLSNSDRCWAASATLQVSSILVMLGDSDEAGNWPLEYSVLKVGKYEKCEPSA